jgi:hypothetical protein
MALSGRERWWYYLAGLRHYLACIFFLFMPFTQALTFNVGFPLKFSELALFMLGFLYLLFQRKVPMPRPVLILLSLLFVAITVSMAVNLIWDYPYKLSDFITRFGYAGDSISRYVYVILALLSFFISLDLFLSRKETYARWWIYGALAAGVYSWYLALFSALKLHVFLLPGMQIPPQKIGPGIIRCGTFLEGNMQGLYLVLSGALCFYVRKFRQGVFLFLTVFTSFSTLSIVSVFVFMILFFSTRLLRRKNLVYVFPALLVFAVATFLFSRTAFYSSYVESKLFGSAEKITNPGDFSKVERVFGIRAAWHMGLHNPLWGVGLANYSRHFSHFAEQGQLNRDDFRMFLHQNQRMIPNNIYMEVWAECGGMALFIFCCFLVLLVYYARSRKMNALFPAMICMLICFMAYPSFIMIYLWSFMALPVQDYIRRRSWDHLTPPAGTPDPA